MDYATEARPCDTCDKIRENHNGVANLASANGRRVEARLGSMLTAKQRRFLNAFRQRPAIAPAARLAGVHRATVYRWQSNTAFADAMEAAAEAFFKEHRAKVLAEEAVRQRWREKRELERRPMRCYWLARAREARRRIRCSSSNQ